MKNNSTKMHIPASTYRVQFHKEFTLNDLEQHIDYLHELGISAIYAAPLFKATPGSMHGYDVTDFHAINPEIGDLHDLKRIKTKLNERGMLWVQDIVPNHMAFDAHNERLMDVLERGERSDFSHYFDINWNHPSPDLKGKLMVPFLGNSLEKCIESGELELSFTERGLEVSYYDNRFPLSVSAYRCLLKESIAISGADGLDDLLELASEAQDQSFAKWKHIKSKWISRVYGEEKMLKLVKDVLFRINGDKAKLNKILRHQHYSLAYWKSTEREINYRRFFTINSLICLRMEDEKVFHDYHSFLYKLYEQNIIDGLRIDHIDGLHNPNEYLNKLRELFGNKCYIVTEKILEASEDMPAHWPVQGDSGYKFLAQVSQLLTNRQGGQELLDFYRKTINGSIDYQRLVLANKRKILEQYMGGEWDNVTRYFFELELQEKQSYDQIKQALGGMMICVPVYRIYPEDLPVSGAFKALLEETFEKATEVFSDSREEFNYLFKLFTSSSDHKVFTFLNRIMQFTGPLTAKGVEDTTFYVFNALISHCEVGDSPSVLGIAAKDFHDQMKRKIEQAPYGLNATATHDTKRGEDARIRLNVLSEIPAEWEKVVKEWLKMNKHFRTNIKKKFAPALNDEYFIYQSIIGGFPQDAQVNDAFVQRLQEYIIKVVREAKVHSNWEEPDIAYEKACTHFVENILSAEHKFVKSVVPFLNGILKYSGIYSMVQQLIKITAPGIPDVYQGCELWDLSFVDPDNRRPVDYKKRKYLLNLLKQHDSDDWKDLVANLQTFRSEGIEKLFVIRKMLHFRKEHPKLFTHGGYQPLLITRKGVVFSFIRQFENTSILVAVPIGLSLLDNSKTNHPKADIILPESARGEWENIFTGERIKTEDNISVEQLFNAFPVAALLQTA